jgi:hypothetical protein
MSHYERKDKAEGHRQRYQNTVIPREILDQIATFVDSIKLETELTGLDRDRFKRLLLLQLLEDHGWRCTPASMEEHKDAEYMTGWSSNEVYVNEKPTVNLVIDKGNRMKFYKHEWSDLYWYSQDGQETPFIGSDSHRRAHKVWDKILMKWVDSDRLETLTGARNLWRLSRHGKRKL